MIKEYICYNNLNQSFDKIKNYKLDINYKDRGENLWTLQHDEDDKYYYRVCK